MASSRWPDTAKDPSGGAVSRAQNMSRYYISNGGGRDTYIASIKEGGKYQCRVEMFHERKDRYDKGFGAYQTKVNGTLKRNQQPDLPSACTLPVPRNPCYHSDGMGRLLSPLPTENRFRPRVRAKRVRPDATKPVIATDKITQFFPPATKVCSKLPTDIAMHDEPAASFTGHIPRSPKTPRCPEELVRLRLPPRVPQDSPASSRVKAKILGYTGHIPQLRYDLDSRGQGRVWEATM